MSRRKFLMQTYGSLYTRNMSFDFSKCAYCNAPKTEFDHVPALNVLDNIDLKMYFLHDGKLNTYPSCSLCNKLLGGCGAITYYERLLKLSEKYSKRLAKIQPWTKQEIDQLGHTLRAYVKANKFKIESYHNQIQHIENQINRIHLSEIDGDGNPIKSQ